MHSAALTCTQISPAQGIVPTADCLKFWVTTVHHDPCAASAQLYLDSSFLLLKVLISETAAHPC